MRVCERVFMSRRPVGTPMTSEFADLVCNERIRLGFTHTSSAHSSPMNMSMISVLWTQRPWAKSYVWYTASSMRWILMPLSSM